MSQLKTKIEEITPHEYSYHTEETYERHSVKRFAAPELGNS